MQLGRIPPLVLSPQLSFVLIGDRLRFQHSLVGRLGPIVALVDPRALSNLLLQLLRGQKEVYVQPHPPIQLVEPGHVLSPW